MEEKKEESTGIESKELPIFHFKQQIIDMIKNNNYCIITGDTGSGKSTQLPQYIFDSEEIYNEIYKNNPNHKGKYPEDKLNIVVTQPRRMAAVAMAQRVCYERNMPFGDTISYTIRFDDQTTPNTKLRYVTDGILVRECLSDHNLSKYQVVILDEAHERSIYTDILFALVKQAVIKRNGDLKLIITSATLNIDQFSKYFFNCPVLKVKGRCYPVEILYGHTSANKKIEESVRAAIRMHLHEGSGDILVFLPGSEDCEIACKVCVTRLQELLSLGKEVPSMLIYPLYGAQSSEDQARVFEKAPVNTRKLIFATNIAETSLTIDGIGFVIDCGYVKQKCYNPRTGMDALTIVPISKVQAIQRAGRAGRTQPGKCYRMYSEQFFKEQMIENTIPEILRVNLASSILTLKSMGIHDVINFDYMESPDKESILQALKQLYLLDAVDEHGKVTPFGQEMTKFPLEPSYSKALITSILMECEEDMITIVSILSTENIWSKVSRTNEEQMEAFLKAQQNFAKLEGDHETFLSIYKKWKYNNFSERWCSENFLNIRALKQARNIRSQIQDLLGKIDLKICQQFIKEDSIYKKYCELKKGLFDGVKKGSKVDEKIAAKEKEKLKKYGMSPEQKNHSIIFRMALCSGFYFNSARKVANSHSDYLLLPEGNIINIDPSSVYSLKEYYPDYVMFTELGGTTIVRGLMRIVSTIELEWIKDYLGKMQSVDTFELAGLTHQLMTSRMNNLKKNDKEVEKNKKDEEQRKLEKLNVAKLRYQERKGQLSSK